MGRIVGKNAIGILKSLINMCTDDGAIAECTSYARRSNQPLSRHIRIYSVQCFKVSINISSSE
jgi:hypothetical protein